MSGKGWAQWIISIALLVYLTTPSYAVMAQTGQGWSLSPGEVRVDGIRLGETASFEITIANNKDFPLGFSISTNIPRPDDLRPGYEPFPDVSWIRVAPQQIELPQFSQKKVTVTVTIPSEGDWGGRNYECWLGATSEAMGIFQIELACRLLLSTSAAYARGADWPLIGGITGIAVIAIGLIYGSRRKLKRWFGRW